MKTEITLEREDLNAMHDVILEATEPTEKITDEIIIGYWKKLPDHIKGIAIQWGCDDTVFRDEMYVWIQNN